MNTINNIFTPMKWHLVLEVWTEFEAENDHFLIKKARPLTNFNKNSGNDADYAAEIRGEDFLDFAPGTRIEWDNFIKSERYCYQSIELDGHVSIDQVRKKHDFEKFRFYVPQDIRNKPVREIRQTGFDYERNI